MKSLRPVVLVFVVLAIAGCSRGQERSENVVHRPGEPDVIYVGDKQREFDQSVPFTIK